MNEKDFTEIIYRELENSLVNSGYIVSIYENLLYKLIIDDKGELQPHNFKSPARGQYAFQTDIVIKKRIAEKKEEELYIPLVVIEIKYGSLTTHDVLTYSAKALKHKDIYPYLRYGLVLGGLKSIPNRFFVHNQGFDFALALEINDKDKLTDSRLLNNVIVEQLKASEMLLELISKVNNNPKQFMNKLEIN